MSDSENVYNVICPECGHDRAVHVQVVDGIGGPENRFRCLECAESWREA